MTETTLNTLPDVETISGLIKELLALMARQAPHALDDATPLDRVPIPHVIFAVQRCFGVQVPPSVMGPDVRTVGQLAKALGTFVADSLRERGAAARPVSSKRVLLVGGLTSPELERAVARRGWRAAMFVYCDPSTGGAAPRVGDHGVIDHFEAIDWSRPLDIVHRIVELYTNGYVDAVVGVEEFGLLASALATTQLGIPGPSLRAVHNTRDKFHMRRCLEQAGLDQVRYAVCHNLAGAQAFLERIGGPIIMKPVSGTGSEGVSRVETAEEVATAFQVAASSAGFSGLLCEEYIDGPEVSLEGYCTNGQFVAVALTDKLTDDNFLETGHQQPTAHPQSVFDAAADIAGRALAALGVENGVTHTEFRISSRGPVLIETHTRMGGDHINVLTRLTTGVDLADLMIAFALGETIEARPVAQEHAAAIRFSTGRAGQVRGVRVPEQEYVPGIHAVLGPPLGRIFTGRSASRERLAHVIATGPTPAAAGQNAEAFLSRIHVDYFEQQQ